MARHGARIWAEEPGAEGAPDPSFRMVHALLGPAAADQAHKPEDGEYDDADQEQIDQHARRVEQQPEDEKDDGSDDEQMDHFGSPPMFTVSARANLAHLLADTEQSQAKEASGDRNPFCLNKNER